MRNSVAVIRRSGRVDLFTYIDNPCTVSPEELLSVIVAATQIGGRVSPEHIQQQFEDDCYFMGAVAETSATRSVLEFPPHLVYINQQVFLQRQDELRATLYRLLPPVIQTNWEEALIVNAKQAKSVPVQPRVMLLREYDLKKIQLEQLQEEFLWRNQEFVEGDRRDEAAVVRLIGIRERIRQYEDDLRDVETFTEPLEQVEALMFTLGMAVILAFEAHEVGLKLEEQPSGRWNRIPLGSAVGQALLGKRRGEVVEWQTDHERTIWICSAVVQDWY